jgi:hypothetical protein
MVEIEGNLLTPNHVVARGEGEWSTAGALAGSGSELPCTLDHVYNMVYNIKLQEGGQIELGNKVYAATLGARLDRTDPGQDPTYYAETTKHLHDLTGYSSRVTFTGPLGLPLSINTECPAYTYALRPPQ